MDAMVSFDRAGWAHVEVHVAEVSPFAALDVAWHAVREAIDRDPVGIEVLTEAEQARRADSALSVHCNG
jgi:hypothetical protein